MRDTAQVVGITKSGMIEVIPFIQDACLSCTVSGCAKRGKTFTVTNPHNLPLESGMMVHVGASSIHQVIQAIVSILIPILCALASQFAIKYYAHRAQIIVSEGLSSGILLLSLFLSALLILIISSKKNLIQSEITAIVA